MSAHLSDADISCRAPWRQPCPWAFPAAPAEKRQARAADRRRAAGDLQSHAARGLHGQGSQHQGGTAKNDFRFEYSKYSGWPEIKESLMAGRIQAGYMLAPLVMDLADKESR